jgi:hypothetical protein
MQIGSRHDAGNYHGFRRQPDGMTRSPRSARPRSYAARAALRSAINFLVSGSRSRP